MAPKALLLSGAATPAAFLERLEKLLPALPPGQVAVVLRNRGAPYFWRFSFGVELRALTERTEQLFFVAERGDLARTLRADGLHLPSEGLLPSDARRIVGRRAWVSRAFHDRDRLPRTELESLDALVVSPVLAPRKGRPPLGLSGLEELRAESLPPLYALGGIAPQDFERTLAAGAAGVVLMGAVMETAPRVLGAALARL